MKPLMNVPQAEAGFCQVPDDFLQVPELHVFTLVDGIVPQLLAYADDEDGREQVAALVRSGTVLGVIRGFAVRYTVESTVTLSGDTDPYTQTALIKSSEVPLGQI